MTAISWLPSPTGFATAADSLVNPSAFPAIGAFFMGFALILIIFAIAAYVYTSLALMKIAKRIGTEPAWLAWIPIGNLYLMSKIAKMHWWPILMLIPYLVLYLVASFLSLNSSLSILSTILYLFALPFELVLVIFTFIWQWKICEARNRPGWWVLLTLIPFFGGIWCFILYGILAWGKE